MTAIFRYLDFSCCVCGLMKLFSGQLAGAFLCIKYVQLITLNLPLKQNEHGQWQTEKNMFYLLRVKTNNFAHMLKMEIFSWNVGMQCEVVKIGEM